MPAWHDFRTIYTVATNGTSDVGNNDKLGQCVKLIVMRKSDKVVFNRWRCHNRNWDVFALSPSPCSYIIYLQLIFPFQAVFSTRGAQAHTRYNDIFFKSHSSDDENDAIDLT